MAPLIDVASDTEFTSHLNSLSPSTLLVLYFYAPWAAPCSQMRAVIEAIAGQYPDASPPVISFVCINAEEMADVSEEFDVTAVPYVVLTRGGLRLEDISGSDAIKVRTAIERHAGGAAPTNGAKTSIPAALSATPRENGPEVATQPPVSASKAPEPAANAIDVSATPSLTPEQSKEALWARLEQLVKAAPVMLFMKGTPSSPQCGFSRQLVGILRERSIKYGFFNILADEDVRQGLKEYADWPTFPQLWVSGELVGGLDIVRDEIENDPSFLDQFSVNKQT